MLLPSCRRPVSDITCYWLRCDVGILAVSEINEAIDRQVVNDTLSALQSTAASLSNVSSTNAVHYQRLLARVKSEKAQVFFCSHANFYSRLSCL